MIQLDAAIDKAEDLQSVKVILKQIVSALNTLNDARTKVRGDLVFVQEGSGPVWRGTDGNYYRQTMSVSGTTVTAVYTNIGPRPKE